MNYSNGPIPRCGCEDGGDCTKTTVCAATNHSEELQERIEELEAEIERLREALEGAESETRRVEEIKDAHAESAWKVHAENTRLREFLGKLEAILRKALEEN